jgi:shikimate dehydrogenase
MDYGRIECPLDRLRGRPCAQFVADGGRGCNVTVPFKTDACTLAARRTRVRTWPAQPTCCASTAEGWWADNTDGVGLVRDIEVNAERSIAGQRVLLIGAGGAGAGVLGPLLQAGPVPLVAVQPHAERRPTEAGAAPCGARPATCVALTQRRLTDPGSPASTSSSTPPPAACKARRCRCLPKCSRLERLAIDLMYGPAAEPFLRWARDATAPRRDGLGMLVEQAAEAFFVWRGVRPPSAPVLAALRQQLWRLDR